jgi:energy-coupling factor transport system permease protein
MSKMHPLAWAAWLTAVTLYAFAVTNPLYVLLALGAVLVVHLGAPRPATGLVRPVRMFLVLGLGLLAVRLVLLSVVSNPGETALAVLPRAALPRWMGGFTLGGPVTAEVLVEGAAEGLRLLLVLVAFGVVNAAVDVPALVRSVPSAFRDAGIVVSIALAFVPGVLRTAREVRDAQLLRGERGLRTIGPSLVVPVLGMSLERALLLAESMDARGYGASATVAPSRTLTAAGLGAVAGGVALWVAGRSTAAGAFVLAGILALALTVRAVSRGARETRLAPPAWRALDIGVALCSLAGVVAGATLARATSYTAYPIVRAPGFSLAAGAAALLFASPLVRGTR